MVAVGGQTVRAKVFCRINGKDLRLDLRPALPCPACLPQSAAVSIGVKYLARSVAQSSLSFAMGMCTHLIREGKPVRATAHSRAAAAGAGGGGSPLRRPQHVTTRYLRFRGTSFGLHGRRTWANSCHARFAQIRGISLGLDTLSCDQLRPDVLGARACWPLPGMIVHAGPFWLPLGLGGTLAWVDSVR